MNTASVTETRGLEESLLLPQLLEDVSVRAPGWSVLLVGLSFGSCSVQVPYDITHPPINITGLVEPDIGLTRPSLRTACQSSPRTSLGKRLWEIRKRIVESGEPLLNWENLERELAVKRGETD